MYPSELVAPMKGDLTQAGFADLTTAEQVDEAVKSEGTVLIVINSVCGCAAANARPAAKLAVQFSEKKPNHLGTVFAGFDSEAVAQTRKHTLPYPPSSPSMALFKDGQLVHFIERHQIEGVSAEMIARNLVGAFEAHC